MVDGRDDLADERDRMANERDRIADEREAAADAREKRQDERDAASRRRLDQMTDPASRAKARAYTEDLLDRSAQAIARGRARLRRQEGADERLKARAAEQQALVDQEVDATIRGNDAGGASS